MSEYEKFWQTSVKTVKRRMRKINARIIHATFRVMVQQRLDILDTSDRRSKWRTPSAKLIADKRCPVFPPLWENEQDGVRQRVNFTCDKEGPKIHMQEVYDKAQRRNMFGCLVCEDFVEVKVGVKCVKCSKDHRIMHERCVNKLELDKNAIRCEQIKEQLVPVKRGQNEVRWKTKMTARQQHAHCMCLICGDKLAVYDAREVTDYASGTVACRYSDDDERPCRFRVHSDCWEAHCVINENDTAGFECARIVHQIKREQIVKISENERTEDRRELIDNLNKFNRVRVNKCKRKRRYSNATDICRICGEEVPFHQKSHLLQHCSGVTSTPVVVENITDYEALGKRCFEIGKRRIEDSKIKLRTPGTPQRSRAVGWGWRPGQRLSEVDPRTKRPRLDFANQIQD